MANYTVWNTNTTFNKGDVAFYNNLWYVSSVDNNTANTPSSVSTSWIQINDDFLQNVTPFISAQDPSTTQDAQNINTYQNLLATNPTAAATFIATMPNAVEMQMNAGRYNEVLNLLGQLQMMFINGIQPLIANNITRLLDVASWQNNIIYQVGNICQYNNNWYICIQTTTGFQQPEVTDNWEDYWDYFILPMPATQYPIQSTQPTGQSVGDLWFQTFPSFADATPSQILEIAQSGLASAVWNLGDEKTIQLTNGTTMTLVIYDLTPNRYSYASGNQMSNIVIGTKELYISDIQMSSGLIVTGGWQTSPLRTYLNSTLYNLLPTEWQSVIPQLLINSVYTQNSSPSVVSTSDYLFVPSPSELSNTLPYNAVNTGNTYGYFETSGDSSSDLRIKNIVNGSIDNWWTRDGYGTGSSAVNFYGITADGDFQNYSSMSSLHYPIFFAM